MQYTTNYNLKKPDLTDPVSVGDLNDNMDIVDAQLSEMMNEASFSANGWFKDKKTGLIIQWGSSDFSSSNPRSLSFPIEFPNACLSGSIEMISASQFSTGIALGRTAFNVYSSCGVQAYGFYWFAIGY
ncbi:gp53-like domain-containing protein [Clostridium sp. DL1XJH146]